MARSGREDLCEGAEFTGWTVPGGYAELYLADAGFVNAIPGGFTDFDAAPLLGAGNIGYRALQAVRLCARCHGYRRSIFGFGGAGHEVIQRARSRGAEASVATRDVRHLQLAAELGAARVGAADAQPIPPARRSTAITCRARARQAPCDRQSWRSWPICAPAESWCQCCRAARGARASRPPVLPNGRDE